jgi:hypothetical protein
VTQEREAVSVGRKKLWGFISSIRPARYITNRGTTLMSLDDLLLCVGRLPAYETFSNPLDMLRAFECVAPASKTTSDRDHAWWKRETYLHQVIADRGTLSLWLPEVNEMNQFDGSRWFIAEDWAYAIIEAMKKGGVRSEETIIPAQGFRKETVYAKVFRADGTTFQIRCS